MRRRVGFQQSGKVVTIDQSQQSNQRIESTKSINQPIVYRRRPPLQVDNYSATFHCVPLSMARFFVFSLLPPKETKHEAKYDGTVVADKLMIATSDWLIVLNSILGLRTQPRVCHGRKVENAGKPPTTLEYVLKRNHTTVEGVAARMRSTVYRRSQVLGPVPLPAVGQSAMSST